MTIDKSKTVSFTGYCPSKILKSSNDPNIFQKISERLDDAVEKLIGKGYDTFLIGMAEGFDLLAAAAVIKARLLHPHIRFIAVLPFEDHFTTISEAEVNNYFKVLNELDYKVVVCEYQNRDAYLRRNDYLLANSSHVVCYYDGQIGGTMYTVNRAVAARTSITNLI